MASLDQPAYRAKQLRDGVLQARPCLLISGRAAARQPPPAASV